MTTTKPAKKAELHKSAIAFVRKIVIAYTKHPETLKVDGATIGGSVVMAIKAHRDDQPRIVGGQGKNILALQTLVEAYQNALGCAIRLTLLEPDTGLIAPRTPFVADPQWRAEPTFQLFEAVVRDTTPRPCEVQHIPVGDISHFLLKYGKHPAPQNYVAALQTIFHAIGRNEGRMIEVMVDDSQGN